MKTILTAITIIATSAVFTEPGAIALGALNEDKAYTVIYPTGYRRSLPANLIMVPGQPLLAYMNNRIQSAIPSKKPQIF